MVMSVYFNHLSQNHIMQIVSVAILHLSDFGHVHRSVKSTERMHVTDTDVSLLLKCHSGVIDDY